jgi:hypothetical protein
MKTRFAPSGTSSYPRSHSFDARRDRAARPFSCVALLDDRFVGWLAQRDSEPGLEPVIQRKPLARTLARVAADSGLLLNLRRIYWYTDRPDGVLVDDQIVRPIHDGAAAQTWERIDTDLRRVAEARMFDSVLIACDDERLLPAIDEAQMSGLAVVMLCDDSLFDFAELSREEPEWAALLAQADRRLVVRSEEFVELVPGAVMDDGMQFPGAMSGGRSTIEEVVRGWWNAQSEESREELRSALSLSAGIPQEVDRELLLQSRERFVRPLSLVEKRQMRDCLRGIATTLRA